MATAWFAMVSGIWATLAPYLATPEYGFGLAEAGAFGAIGEPGPDLQSGRNDGEPQLQRLYRI